MEQSKLQAAAHQHMLDDDDFGEGEVEDTQAINEEGSLAAAQNMQTPLHQKTHSLALKQSR